MAFLTIFVPSGLSERDYQQALRAGPSAVSSGRREHVEMLTAAGFADVQEIDLTAEFLITTSAWFEGRERRAKELREAEGEELFEERQRDSAMQLEGIEAGLLRRSLFVATKPKRRTT
jgi:hypothetical protein